MRERNVTVIINIILKRGIIMYHAQLKIRCFHDVDLKQILLGYEPEKNFSHLVEEYDCFYPEIIATSDILIVKIEQLNISDIQSYKKKNALLILCVTYEQWQNLSSEVYEVIDDIWILPWSIDFLKLRIKQIFHQIKERKDKDLHEQYLNTLIDSMPDMVWFKDNDGIHLKVNKAFCHTVGKTREDVTGKDHCYIWDVPKEEFEKGEFVCNETEDLVRKLRKTCRFDEKVKSKKGLRQFHTYKSPIFNEEGDVIGTVGIGHDITDLQNMSTELEIVLRSMPFAILVKNDKNEIININKKFEEYFHVHEIDLVGHMYDEWKASALKDIIDCGDYYQCINMLNNENQILEYHIEPIFDIFETLVGQLCIFRDITVETNLEKQIIWNSHTDFMTGLYNRRYLYEYMNEQHNQQSLCLLYVDLDEFKKINDTFGHQVGDTALLEATRILKDCFKNDFNARIGGDEFLVIIKNDVEKDIIEKKVQTCIKAFRDTMIPSIHQQLLSACIGITTHHGQNADLDELIKQADAALYKAKQLGKGHYCFYDK